MLHHRTSLHRFLATTVLCCVIGCYHAAPVEPASATPALPNTVLLSSMMRELSARPGFTDALLAELDKTSKTGAALLTPALLHRMRELILGKDWQGLDRFPGWTMREITPTVRVVGHVAGKYVAPASQIDQFLDLGLYSTSQPVTIDLDHPSTLPGFSSDGLVFPLGAGVVRGDGPDPALAPLHAESKRLSEVLNRLTLNQAALDNTAPATARIGNRTVSTPQDLIAALIASGHTVELYDARYFANFGHLHANGQDVMMPFWVNTRLAVPHTNRPFLLPVTHTEYEWAIRGPRINANISWYFGIDGKAEFRTMDTLDQAWVMGRHAHTYTGPQALEVTRLTGLMIVAYIHQHLARPTLPFGGYYALGVCQDSVAAIEKKLTGNATLFPNTADPALFNDPRDGEINALMKAIPKDRAGLAPDASRVLGSLPTDDFAHISVPGLAPDLLAVQQAYRDGTLHQIHPWWWRWLILTIGFIVGISFVLVLAALRQRRRLTVA